VKDNDAPLLIDVSRLVWRRWKGTRATGIDRICMAWLEHYAARAQAVVVHRRGQAILPYSTSQALFKLLLRPERARRDVGLFRRDLIALGVRRGNHLRDRLSGRGRLWLNPGHTGLDVPGIAQWCQRRGLRPVYLVHDLIPITHPQFCREGEDVRHRRRMSTVLESAAGVVANSADTLDSLAAFAAAEGARMPPTVIAWPGTPRLPLGPPATMSAPTFVALGTIEGRKNHRLLLSVWRALLAAAASGRAQEPLPRLVIVGRRGWQAQEVFTTLDNADFGGLVSEAGALPDGKLGEVLAGARALLFPSLAEGYGMPLAEALAAGVPVIASDLPVFREIGQGVPELLPPNDTEAWLTAIFDYARPDSLHREEQAVRLKDYKVPEWYGHFARVDALLEKIALPSMRKMYEG
jgi:glycosyltransferase involved in cell wall biosynthesis